MLLLLTGASGVGTSTCRVAIEAAPRLRRRGESAELLPHHVAFADWMRKHVRDPGHMPEVITNNAWDAMRWERWADADWSFDVIDTSGRAPDAVAADSLSWVTAARA